ncbi:hypothetical protein DL93DRAFT_891006 [Clavulina sp. PMI_390]|nr:hypothetical protein DL93DRAFT_891006 [Clavulina sp. PMI_390]
MEFFAAMELISDLGRTLTWICYDDPNIVSVLRQDLIPALEVCLTRVKRWSSDNASLSQASGYRYVWVYWLAIEQAYRLMLAANDDWTTGHFINAFLTQAVDALLRIGFSSIVDDLNNHQPIRNNVADVWVCIIHLLQAPGFKKHPGIWSLVINIVQRASWLPSDPLGGSEVIWKAAFGITALSQFSPSGRLLQAPLLAAAWPLVEAATSPIFFGIDRDGSTGASVLEERDLYLRGILGRCLLLRLRWRWDLSDALDVLHCLGHIFRSRDFCGLHGESCGFPPFLTQFGQFSLVEVFDPDDAGYDIFLKLVVLAISDLRSSPSHGAENGVKKLMSTLTPVSTTNFTPSSPPASERHLAKLYNLYSSILTAAHVDPLGAQGFTRRLRQAFIVSNFQTADMMSRSVIVRAVGLFCTEALRKGYPLVNIISWWEEILAQVLLFFNDDAISAPLLMRSVLESMLSTFQTGLQHRQRQFLQHRLLHSTFIAKILDVRHPFQPKEAILSLINVYIDLFAFTVTPSPVYDEASLGATLRVAILKRDENDASHDLEWLSTAKVDLVDTQFVQH